MFNKRLNQEAMNRTLIFALLVCFAVAGGVLAIGQGYYIATVVDQVFLQEQGLQTLWRTMWLLLAIFIGRGIIIYFTTKVGVKLAGNIKGKLRKQLVIKLAHTAPDHLFRQKSGQLVSVITDAIDQIDLYYSRYLPQVIQAAIIPPMILAVVFTHSIYSGLIMLITAPLIPIFMNLIGNMADSKAQQQMNSLMKFSGHFLDVLQGLTTLKIFGQSKNQRKQIDAISIHFQNTTMEVLKIAFISALMLEILATISTAMIAVEVGLRLVYANISFKSALFILLLAPELYLPLKNMGSAFHSGRNSIAAAEKVWQALDENERKVNWGDREFPQPKPPRITIENISFHYQEKRPVLSNINFDIKPGEQIAIIGKSGSGKTTLLKILLGLLPPTQGRILVNGLPLQDISEDSWIEHVAFLSQEPYLFSGTIAENIGISKSNASGKQIETAAELAGVSSFIEELSNRYDTAVGEAGRGLSGGEKQRVALARAFLKRAPIVILDEPTAGLDLETEHIMKQAMVKLSENATVFTVAHRLQTVLQSDKIILLSEGKINAWGTHQQLLQQSNLYRELISAYRGEEQ